MPVVLDPSVPAAGAQRNPDIAWLEQRPPSLAASLPRASAVPKCGVSGALIPSSCEFSVAIISVVEDGDRFTPESAFGGWGGTVHGWWDYLQGEPGCTIPKHREFFAIPYALGGRRVFLIPRGHYRDFAAFQARMAFLYPAAVWETDLNDVAPAEERAGFSRAVEAFADTVVKCDRDGRPTARTINVKRALRAVATGIRDGDTSVADAYADAGERLAVEAANTATAAGDAAATAVNTPRRPPANPWGLVAPAIAAPAPPATAPTPAESAGTSRSHQRRNRRTTAAAAGPKLPTGSAIPHTGDREDATMRQAPSAFPQQPTAGETAWVAAASGANQASQPIERGESTPATGDADDAARGTSPTAACPPQPAEGRTYFQAFPDCGPTACSENCGQLFSTARGDYGGSDLEGDDDTGADVVPDITGGPDIGDGGRTRADCLIPLPNSSPAADGDDRKPC